MFNSEENKIFQNNSYQLQRVKKSMISFFQDIIYFIFYLYFRLKTFYITLR